MPVDPDLLADVQQLRDHFGLPVIGVDYMIDREGRRHLLEVNHIPNVTVFPEIRRAYPEYVVKWVDTVLTRPNSNSKSRGRVIGPSWISDTRGKITSIL